MKRNEELIARGDRWARAELIIRCIYGIGFCLVLIVLAIMFLVSSAQANTNREDHALQIAAKYWGVKKCDWRDVRIRHNLSYEATGYWGMAPYSNMCIGPYAKPSFRLAYDVDWTWLKLCHAVVHEYGHQVGELHASAVGSPMYPMVVESLDQWRLPQCTK